MSRRRDALARAYRRARYRVADGDAAFDMRIGEPCEPLRALMARRGVGRAAFLTACNPRSVRRSDDDNRAAQALLRAAAESAGFVVLDGAGLDPDGDWPPEPSLLVLGIDRERAAALAERFGQNAFVWLAADATPVLVWTGAPDDAEHA